MLTLHINQSSATHLFELPLPLDLLADELRNLGISKPLHQLTQHDFILQAMNPLGAHFMKLLQPDDSLHAIAMYAREFDVMTGESRQALADLVMTDRFYDLDHMANYLQHGSAALTHLLRLSLGGKHIDLPAPTQELCEFLGCSPRKVLLSDVDYTPLNAQGRELLTSLRPYDNLAVTNLAGTLMDVPDIKVTMDEVVGSARNLLSEQPMEKLIFYCPLIGDIGEYDEDGDYFMSENVNAKFFAEYTGKISRALLNDQQDESNMTNYLPDALMPKIASIVWDAERIGEEVYGKISCELRALLTAGEQAELVEWIEGQNSDGFGEGFEQRPIEIDHQEELYVKLWRSDADYFILPAEKFFQQLHEQTTSQTQTFGGMGDMA